MVSFVPMSGVFCHALAHEKEATAARAALFYRKEEEVGREVFEPSW